MELTTTKEQVLGAASKNPESKELLKDLFPKAFEELKFTGWFDIKVNGIWAITNAVNLNRLFLNNRFNWEIISRDNGHSLFLEVSEK